MKTLTEVLPKFHQGFMIINYTTLKRYELVKNAYGAEFIRVTYDSGKEQLFKTELTAFAGEDTTTRNWGVGCIC